MVETKKKKIGITVLAAAALALGSGTALAGWTVTDLSTWQGGSGTYSYASAINNNGQIVGGINPTGSGPNQATLWSGGVATSLDSLAGGSTATVINDSGVIGGSSRSPRLATSWTSTVAGYLPANIFPDAMDSYGFDDTPVGGINNAGDMVGIAIGGGQNSAFLYHGGSTALLNGLGFGSSGAYDINNSGQIAGYSQATFTSQVLAVVWQNGGSNPKTLKDLSGGTGSDYAKAINDSGQVAGIVTMADGATSAAFWINGEGALLPSLSSAQRSDASAINSSGVVVGFSKASDGTNHAVIWKDGVITDLNTLIGSGWMLEIAGGINDLGQIVGSGINPQGQSVAFLLTPGATPTPIPAALPLFCSALAALGVVRRKSARV